MKNKIMPLLMAASLMVPYARLWADNDKAESPKEEQTESSEVKQTEESRAMQHYNDVVAKNGADSAQAKKAWKHVQHEYKEHGDPVPTSPSEVNTSTSTTPAP